MVRHTSVLSRTSSFDVRESSGPSLKSAIQHILSIDLRNDVIFPSCGSLTQLITEVAGLGGNVGFIKNELYVQGNYPLASDIVSDFLQFVLFTVTSLKLFYIEFFVSFDKFISIKINIIMISLNSIFSQVFQITASTGILKGIGNDMQIGLSDMFYLGGPLDMRGFQMRGIGPRVDSDAVGADVSTLSLFPLILKIFFMYGY